MNSQLKCDKAAVFLMIFFLLDLIFLNFKFVINCSIPEKPWARGEHRKASSDLVINCD